MPVLKTEKATEKSLQKEFYEIKGYDSKLVWKGREDLEVRNVRIQLEVKQLWDFVRDKEKQ